jgi:hypothetical protein
LDQRSGPRNFLPNLQNLLILLILLILPNRHFRRSPNRWTGCWKEG